MSVKILNYIPEVKDKTALFHEPVNGIMHLSPIFPPSQLLNYVLAI